MESNQLKRSRKKKKTTMFTSNSISGEDRISNLPESILHHILSFMDMREVVQTSFISTYWRYVWKSVPVLNFDYSLWKDTKNKKQVVRPYVKRVCRKRDECMDFVDRVLLFRDYSANIQKLYISHHYGCDVCRINTWLSFAVKRHVKEVYLRTSYTKQGYTLPHFLFTSGIEVFRLESCTIPLQDSKIRSLELESAQITQGHSNNKLILKSDNAADRISGLPDAILHHILSFLDMKEVVKTSLVATRWKCLWASVPDLSFTSYFSPGKRVKHSYGKKVYRQDRNMDFVDKVLFLRDESNIRKLNLRGSDSGRVITWLIYALKRHVKEVHILFSFPQQYELPHCLFTGGIEVCVLKSYDTWEYITISPQLPNSMCSARQLRALELESIQLPRGNLNGELVLSCSVLESLILKNCRHGHLKALTISARQLKKLVVVNRELNIASCEIKISTPNLTSLKLYGSSYKDYFLESLSSLVNSSISSSLPIGGYSMRGEHASLLTRSFAKILNGLYNTATLEIYGSWSKASSVSDQLLNPFSNLRCLKLIGLDSGSCIQDVAKLLKSSPYIETLVLEVNEHPEHPYIPTRENYWGEELSFKCRYYHLKNVKVQNVKGCENEVKFLEFLLKNAMVLENITITSRDREVEEFSKKLHSLPKASSSVTISFLSGRVGFSDSWWNYFFY